MNVDRISSLRACFGDEPAPCLLVARVVGVLAYGHAEDVAESCPIRHIASLVEHSWQKLGKDAQFAFLSDEEHVGELLKGYALHLALILEYAMVYGVVVLPVDEVVANEALFISPELHERESVELSEDTVLSELLEPW